jgi:hypothetical protein
MPADRSMRHTKRFEGCAPFDGACCSRPPVFPPPRRRASIPLLLDWRVAPRNQSFQLCHRHLMERSTTGGVMHLESHRRCTQFGSDELIAGISNRLALGSGKRGGTPGWPLDRPELLERRFFRGGSIVICEGRRGAYHLPLWIAY